MDNDRTGIPTGDQRPEVGAHTPGPWTVGYHALNVFAEDAKGSFPICDIRGWGHLTGKGHGALGLRDDEAIAIQKANARLIAAAPDLLAIVQDMLSGLAYLRRTNSIPYGFGIDRLEETGRAAIAKAMGETP